MKALELPNASPSALVAFAATGVAMIAFVAVGPWIIRALGYSTFIPVVAASGLLTILATWLVPHIATRNALAITLGLALVMRLLLVGDEPFLSTDLYRYIWDGRVQASGINPYLYVPADPALAALRDTPIFPNINRAEYAVTAYPPIAEMFFLAVTRIAETPAAMRLAMVGLEGVIAAVVIDLLRRLTLPPAAVVAYVWHPLAIWESASSGHVEVVMVALLMVGVWLLVRARPIAGAVAVVLAALAKPYAIVIMPAFWRPWDRRVPLALCVTLLACYAPYLGAGKGVFGFASAGYVSEEGLSSGTGMWLTALVQSVLGPLPSIVPVYVAATVASMIALGVSYRFDPQRTPAETLRAAFVLLTAGLLLLSPNYAWYFLALVPFIPLGGGAIAWALTLGAFMLYRPVLLGSSHDLIWKSLSMLPFLLVVALMLGRSALHRRRQVGHAA